MVYAAAVVTKHADGTATVKQADEPRRVGGLTGTALGSLDRTVGRAGGLGHRHSVRSRPRRDRRHVDDVRVGEDFVADVSKSFTAKKVAVIAEVEEEWTTPVDTRMEALRDRAIAARCRKSAKTAGQGGDRGDEGRTGAAQGRAREGATPNTRRSSRSGSISSRERSMRSEKRRKSTARRFKRARRRSAELFKTNVNAPAVLSSSWPGPPSRARP